MADIMTSDARQQLCKDAADSTTMNCEQANDIPNKGAELLANFKDFEVCRVLNNSTEQKYMVVEGHLPGKEGTAVVVLEKPSFNEDNLEEVFCGETSMKLSFNNEEYYQKTASLKQNEIKVKIIYPAEEEHILGHEKQTYSAIKETPKLYEEITRPYIEQSTFRKEWIQKLLDHEQAPEGIVYEDSDPDLGFTLVREPSWTGEQVDDMNLLAVVRRKDLKTLRDLRASHIPLLKNISEKGAQFIKEKYGLLQQNLRIYIHYLPTICHFHVHFTSNTFNAPGTVAGRAHVLSDVISTLEIIPEYYANAVLSVILEDNHFLHTKFEEKGRLQD